MDAVTHSWVNASDGGQSVGAYYNLCTECAAGISGCCAARNTSFKKLYKLQAEDSAQPGTT